MAIVLEKCSVELVQADDWRNLLLSGWLNSRPSTKPSEVKMSHLLEIDTPLSELAGFVLNMRIPILFRELIANMRDHIMWARTSRVDDLTNWGVVSGIRGYEFGEITRLHETMMDQLEQGLPQDNFRENLPLGYMTSITCRLSLRSALRLVRYLNYLAYTYPTLTIPAIQLEKELMTVLEDCLVPVTKVLPRVKVMEFFPSAEPDQNMLGSARRIGSTVVVQAMMPLSLRAQLVRHRSITVSDMTSMLFKSDAVWSTPIKQKTFVEASGRAVDWIDIISKRACWMAQADLWSDLVRLVSALDMSNLALLPCAGGACPYKGDAMERLAGRDPGVPCPRHINLHGNDGHAYSKDDMARYIIQSNRPLAIWGPELNQVKTYEPSYDWSTE